VLPPFNREAARDYKKIPTPKEPILEELGPSRSSKGSIASGSSPKLQGLPVQVPHTPPSIGLSPSRPETPVEYRGGRATKDLEDLLLEGPSPSRKATKPSKRSPKLLKLAYLWYKRLGHISLRLLKKTAKITQGVPNFNSISEGDFLCLACNKAKAVRRLNHRPIDNPEGILDSLEGNTFSIKPIPYNKYPIRLLIVDRKSRFR